MKKTPGKNLIVLSPEFIYSIESKLLQGMTRDMVEFAITREAAEKNEPAPTPEMVTQAFAILAERWVTDACTDPEEINGFHIRARKHLYAKSYKLNDFKTCLAVLADLAKIQHQYAEQTAARRQKPANAKTELGSDAYRQHLLTLIKQN